MSREIEVVLGRNPVPISDELFKSLQERATAGTLRAEYGCPRPTESSVKKYIDRISEINEGNVCASIVDVRRSDDQTHLIGKIRTDGPMGSALETMIDMGVNFSFSMRSLRDSDFAIKSIVTFDLINPV